MNDLKMSACFGTPCMFAVYIKDISMNKRPNSISFCINLAPFVGKLMPMAQNSEIFSGFSRPPELGSGACD